MKKGVIIALIAIMVTAILVFCVFYMDLFV